MDTSSHPTARWSLLGVVLVSLVGLRLHTGGRTTVHDVLDVRSRTVRTVVHVPVLEPGPSLRVSGSSRNVGAPRHPLTTVRSMPSVVVDHLVHRSSSHLLGAATSTTTTTTTTTRPAAAVPVVSALGSSASRTPPKVLEGWVAAPDDAVALYPLSPTSSMVSVALELTGTATATLTCGSATTSSSAPSATLALAASTSCSLDLSTSATTATSFTATVTGATW